MVTENKLDLHVFSNAPPSHGERLIADIDRMSAVRFDPSATANQRSPRMSGCW